MAGRGTERARGTSWRIWDLHVHTPASIVQGYGGNTEEAWSRYLDELENLPGDIGVVGINDYWFIDGYRRVCDAKRSGRLKNLDAIFPVVEMRLDQFGGTDGNLSRVNLHVIFDPELDADVIQAQFLNALQPKLTLSREYESAQWQGVITPDSLSNLGAKIKASVPADQLKKFGSDLREGFNNLNVSLVDVQNVLAGPFFRGRALLGIGKTEWAAIRWTDQSIAAKKNVINSADLIFTAFQDATRWKTDVEVLRANRVNGRLLDCSDAHYFSDSDQPMRLGACQTWLNTAPTLAGLAYALGEFDRRVYVGLEPPALARIRTNPERFASSVSVSSDSPDHKLFDYRLPLNSGFIAVVGNKGQGKSALLDCIALAGNSSRNNEFAFLTPKRFLSTSSTKVAKEYYSELEWATGSSRRAQLPDDYDRSAPVYVEYLPQAFVERVCNIDPATDDADEFERELRIVLFTHIREEDRSGEKTFDALLAQRTRSSQDAIKRLRGDLGRAITAYVAETLFRTENQLSEVEGRLSLKEDEAAAARTSLDSEAAALAELDAASSDDGEFAALKNTAATIEIARSDALDKKAANEQLQAQIRQALSSMEALAHQAASLLNDAAALNASAAGILTPDGDPFVSVTINNSLYDTWRSAAENDLAAARTEHLALVQEVEAHEEARRRNADSLASADSARERARQRVLQSEARLAAIIGDENDEESVTGLQQLRSRIIDAPREMDRLRQEMLEYAGRIHDALRAQLRAVEGLYAPASEFIAQSEVVRNAGLEFNAELRMLPTWRNLPKSLDGRRNGEFTDWLADMPVRIEDTSWEQLSSQLLTALNRLEHERGEPEAPFRNPSDALRGTTDLGEFLMNMLDLSWLEVRFGLTGDGLPLSQLSPGQRGLVLALFYLVIDRRTTPLLLDQPEENLDNETIASKLVPALHEASGRRQTIVVTHNANLAIVGDADQIVHCQMQDGRFFVSSGSIAEVDVARFALDVLEGTKPAFDNRRHKYEAFPGLA